LIVWGSTRSIALRKMKYTLERLICLGVKTNQALLIDILKTDLFNTGNYNTQYIEKYFQNVSSKKIEQDLHHALIAASLIHWKQRSSKRKILRGLVSGWRNNFYQGQQIHYIIKEKELSVTYRVINNQFKFNIEEASYLVEIMDIGEGRVLFQSDDERVHFDVAQSGNELFTHNAKMGTLHFTLKDRFPKKVSEKLNGAYVAPMPSQVVKVLVKVGDEVKKNDGLIVLSSMKMENLILAEKDGVVEEVFVEENTNIDANQTLLKINAEN
ncbi:MAG: biotin/lipoyl-containing protein, partial [Bacteroidota bacterium]